MTALDDLLNSSSLVMYPASIVAIWAELEPVYSSVATVTSAESLIQLGQQIGPQGATVTQSFDDGLPDPVTLTGNNDAAGTLQMDLVGRPSAVAADSSLGGNGNWSQGNVSSSTSFTTSYPTGVAFWDYTFITITINTNANLTETSMAADSPYAWKLLGMAEDTLSGAFQRTFVFGRKHYTSGVVTPVFTMDKVSSATWVMQSVKSGRTPSNGVLIPVTPGQVTTFAEGATAVTTHTPPNVSITGRGWNIGCFGAQTAAGTWSAPPGGSTVFGFYNATVHNIANIISPFRVYPGSYGIAGITSNNAQLVTAVHFALEVRDRPQLDAVGYFSPLNTQSPIYGFERDTAALTMSINNIATDGNQTETTRIFTGQMTGIDIQGRTATANGLSKTRMLLDDSHELPTVYGWREGLETDWLIGYLLAQGGQYTGVAPSIYTRWWAPMHGSLHPWMAGSSEYTESRDWLSGRAGSYRISPPVTSGPFVTAMFAEMLNSHTSFISGTADRFWPTEVPGQPTALFKDLLSQQSSTGRLSFWIRGDYWDQNPTCVDSGLADDVTPFYAVLWNNVLGGTSNYVRVQVNPNRNFTVWIGSSITLTGGDLPTDGAWHFISFMWDYDNGVGKFRRDGLLWNTGTLGGASETLPSSQAWVESTGGYVGFTWHANVPVAELQLEAGMPFTDDWSRFYPTPTSPSLNVTFRPTRQPMAVIAEPTPVQGWSTLQELAESTLSWMRVNELDNVEFVPLTYFGETAQMTVTTLNVLDTNFNAGEIGLNLDPSRTRNVVTVEYSDTRVGSARSSILEMNTSLAVPRGVTYVTFPLDVPTAETHGAAQWWASTPTFQKLTSAQIAAGPTGLPNENIMTVNTSADGSGTVFTSTAFTARIFDWTSNSITVQFTNTYSSTLYIANNGQSVPFLRALGYAITVSDGYSTVRDDGSIGKRRERALTTGLNWVHDRTTAQSVASTLVTLLARPRPVVTVTVQGDPRRVPGNLCQIVDATGTQAAGTWRITSVGHRYTGPMYVQDVTLIYVGVTGVWDTGVWDDAVWGA
jgi:hypothetical protein